MGKFDVVGFGALNFDKLHVVDKFPRNGDEIPIELIREGPGGSAANTTVGLARLGLKTGFIGIVGYDYEGGAITKEFEKENVDTSGILVTQSGRTGQVIGYVDKTGERTLTVHPGVNSDLKITDINLGYAERAKYVHLSSFVSEKQLDEQKQLVESLRGKVRFSFMPGRLYARLGMRKLRPILRYSRVVFLHSSELEILSDMDYRDGSRRLLEEGVDIVAVTLGSDGCYVVSKDFTHPIDSYAPGEVADTTGAGDAFAAGFLHGLLSNRSLLECGRLGHYIASECVKKIGARKGLPYNKKFLNRLPQTKLGRFLPETLEDSKKSSPKQQAN